MKKFFLVLTSGFLAFTFFITPVLANDTNNAFGRDFDTSQSLISFVESSGLDYIIQSNSTTNSPTATYYLSFIPKGINELVLDRYDRLIESQFHSQYVLNIGSTQFKQYDYLEGIKTIVYSSKDFTTSAGNIKKKSFQVPFWEMVKRENRVQVKALLQVFSIVSKTGLVVFSALLSLILLVRFLNSVIY